MKRVKKIPVWLNEDQYGQAKKMLKESGINFWVDGQGFYFHKQTAVVVSVFWLVFFAIAISISI